jgi:hypothetical protein
MATYRDRHGDAETLPATLPSRPAEDLCGTPAARTWAPLVEPGMYVRGVAGDEIGQVKDVRTGDFLVDRSGSLGFGPNGPVYLPFERIHAMLGDRITLDIPSSQIEQYASEPSAFSL